VDDGHRATSHASLDDASFEEDASSDQILSVENDYLKDEHLRFPA
jgi:hypothetical protein